jgi:hypothetical protein
MTEDTDIESLLKLHILDALDYDNGFTLKRPSGMDGFNVELDMYAIICVTKVAGFHLLSLRHPKPFGDGRRLEGINFPATHIALYDPLGNKVKAWLQNNGEIDLHATNAQGMFKEQLKRIDQEIRFPKWVKGKYKKALQKVDLVIRDHLTPLSVKLIKEMENDASSLST